MSIRNHQLHIRPLLKEDAPFLAKWLSNPAVLEFNGMKENTVIAGLYNTRYDQEEQKLKLYVAD